MRNNKIVLIVGLNLFDLYFRMIVNEGVSVEVEESFVGEKLIGFIFKLKLWVNKKENVGYVEEK